MRIIFFLPFVIAAQAVATPLDAGPSAPHATALESAAPIKPRALAPEVFDRLTPVFSGVASLQVQGKEVFSKIAGQADARG